MAPINKRSLVTSLQPLRLAHVAIVQLRAGKNNRHGSDYYAAGLKVFVIRGFSP